jgi:DNA-binding protein Fis
MTGTFRDLERLKTTRSIYERVIQQVKKPMQVTIRDSDANNITRSA